MIRFTIFIFLLSSTFCWPWPKDPSLEFIKINATKLSNLTVLPSSLNLVFEQYKVITVGEIHGTQESPAFITGLVSLLSLQKKTVLLALEINQENQSQVDAFLQDGDLEKLKQAPFFQREFQDGRSSWAMANILLYVRDLKNVVVRCFDPASHSSDGQDRDSKMAINLRSFYNSLNPSIMVVLAGNIHSKASIGTPWNELFRPMAYELFSQAGSPFEKSDILAIKQRYLKGFAWICLNQTSCGKTPINAGETNYSNANMNYFFLPEKEYSDGYNATIFSKIINMSPPLIQDSGNI